MTQQQKKFCRYMIATNYCQREAAIRAGYSEKTADQSASRLMRRDDIKAQIAKEQKEALRQKCVTPERVVMELMRAIERINGMDDRHFDGNALAKLISRVGDMLDKSEQLQGGERELPKLWSALDGDSK